jgi:hypothetical protein
MVKHMNHTYICGRARQLRPLQSHTTARLGLSSPVRPGDRRSLGDRVDALCPRRKPPCRAVKRPARPCKTANAKPIYCGEWGGRSTGEMKRPLTTSRRVQLCTRVCRRVQSLHLSLTARGGPGPERRSTFAPLTPAIEMLRAGPCLSQRRHRHHNPYLSLCELHYDRYGLLLNDTIEVLRAALASAA